MSSPTHAPEGSRNFRFLCSAMKAAATSLYRHSSSIPARKRLNPKLCFVAQPEFASTPEAFQNLVKSAVKGGATCVQLRCKKLGTKDFTKLAERTKQVIADTAAFPVPLIINDRIDVALAIDADGVHVGQDDMPAAVARRLLGKSKILGVTVSNPTQAHQALLDGASYLGTDAIFPTPTKPESKPLGLARFSEICAATSLDVMGIGGTLDVLRF